MKKAITLLCVASMLCTLVACSESNAKPTEENTSNGVDDLEDSVTTMEDVIPITTADVTTSETPPVTTESTTVATEGSATVTSSGITQPTTPPATTITATSPSVPSTPPVLSKSVAKRVKSDYQRHFLDSLPQHLHPENGYNVENISIDRYYGTYNSSVALMMSNVYEEHQHIQWEEKVAGYVFAYSDGNRILVWNDGMFYKLPQAYEQGFLTKQDVERIFSYQNIN
jgi:ABC-type phosphate/phosphonate transport system substrate-binding protein